MANERLWMENERLRMAKAVLNGHGLLREGRRVDLYRFVLAEKRDIRRAHDAAGDRAR